ncbi:hypothetical protein EV138_3151 [Kribbella voronezhensis]|uniref:Uncharacterized protein n=1 Tax=Kribbella voronezhensis TaxID=2512212 RepID=A0A4R7TDW3_9ACTN|nr:hypothetical protein [Kribbella voronezhensis]TDU89578.1 hypothetical protein EV138_3151 [Kribbella voronezhensis]
MSSRFDTIVRCSAGHLFTTKWMPLGSFKAIRLGRRRYQRCPVGHHWAIVRKVAPDTLTPEERETAARTHDTSVI